VKGLSPGRRLLLAAAFAALGVLALALARRPHILEFAHYYTGAKYVGEVGYEGLYEALTAALAEIYGEERLAGAVTTVRRLDGKGFTSPRDALAAFERKRGRWEPGRWASFVEDVRFLDGSLKRYSDEDPLGHWRTVLRDHGYNASPLYTALASAVAKAVPLRGGGLLLLCSLDALLLSGVFVLLAAVFGVSGAVFAFLFFCSSWEMLSYVTWAFLRFDWLFALTLAVFLLSRRRFFLAGFFWGIAAVLRIFPGVLALFFLLLWIMGDRGRASGRGERSPFIAGGFLGTVSSVVFSSAALTVFAGLPFLSPWREFLRRISLHAAMGDRLNGVGIGKIFEAVSLPGAPVIEPLLGLVLTGLLVAALVRRGGELRERAALAVFCAPMLLYLGHYYYLMLILPAALKDRALRYTFGVLMAVNAAVWAGKISGLDYYRLLDAECLAYSIVLLTVPAVLWRRCRRPEEGEPSPVK
jgi:hypothetical protein